MFVSHCFFRRVLLTALAFLLLVPSPLPAQKLLRIKFEAGEKYQVTSRFDVQVDAFTLEMGTTSKIEVVIRATVATDSADADGSVRQTLRLDRVRFKMQDVEDGEQVYDSTVKGKTAGEVALMAELFENTIGVPVKQTVDAWGIIKEVESPELVQRLRGLLQDENFFWDVFNQMPIELPEKAVVPGESWTVSLPRQLDPIWSGDQSLSLVFTYRGTETIDGRQLDKIEFKSDMQPSGKQDDAFVHIQKIKTVGTAWLDASSGRIVRTSMNYELTVKMGEEDDAVLYKRKGIFQTEAEPVEE